MTQIPAYQHDDHIHHRGAYVTGGEEFTRDTNYIEDRITRDGTPGRNGEPGWPVEPGRYRLIAARACPWANRTVIVRRLLGLEDVSPSASPAPPTTPAPGPLTSIRRQGSGPRHRADPGRLFPPVPRTTRAGSPCRRSWMSPVGPGGHQQLPADHPGLLHRVDAVSPPRCPGPVPGAPAGRDRRRQQAGSSPR